MIKVSSFEEFAKYTGQEFGVSDYMKISQEQINQFADATLDHQWIHVDVERAKKESPFNSTIAHGYLTLSILPHLWDEIMEVDNVQSMINYGIENLRFQEPVLVGDEVRLRVKLKSCRNLRGVVKTEMDASLEIKGKKKNAYDATIVFLYYFK
ncbi:MaoC domain protein dehydratase [Bacteroides coprosuis DSM 18011]|uniref:MaoC domain protein dehydratase n=1 Tax=Bacteroides coprosuis DSM 18011 TaxID=679937 RepID=F3ZRD9_9BACE|nr:MaoC family dehydratase [Bacteroides coprosuis]EGJ71947.1 MaoC domain protein dehydratase [Bacteroides coprosuis DSM 18011]